MVEEAFSFFFFFFIAEWQNESGQDLKGIRKVIHTGSWERETARERQQTQSLKVQV